MSNVIDFKTRQKLCNPKIDWEAEYAKCGKLEMLEEMVEFQEARSRAGGLTLDLIERGIPLFARLNKFAETADLYQMPSAYLRHLHHERQRLTQTPA